MIMGTMKDKILENISETLFEILYSFYTNSPFSDDDIQDMRKTIHEFVQAKAEMYTEQELLVDFSSGDKLIDSYIEYLLTRIEIAGSTIH